MTTPAADGPPPTSPGGGLPASGEERAAELGRLLDLLAVAKSAHTKVYARAFIETAGQMELRTQTARLAAADEQLTVDVAEAAAETFRLLIDLDRWAALGSDLQRFERGIL